MVVAAAAAAGAMRDHGLGITLPPGNKAPRFPRRLFSVPNHFDRHLTARPH